MSRKQLLESFVNKTVASSLVPEQITAVSQYVKSVAIQGLPTNTDFIYVGDRTRQLFAIAPGKSITIHGDGLDHGGYGEIDISLIFIKVSVNGEGASILALQGT